MNNGIVTVTLNPAIDETLDIPDFGVNRVNRVDATVRYPGGKGINVARVLADDPRRPGIAVTGFLGSENDGVFRAMFHDCGIADHFVRVPGRTRHGIKILDRAAGTTTDINYPGLEPTPDECQALLTRIERLADDYPVFVISGSLSPSLPAGYIAEIIELVQKKSGTVIVDTSGEALKVALRCRPDAIKPNIHELAQLLQREITGATEVAAAGQAISAPGMLTAVSMGAEGAVFCHNGQQLLAIPPQVSAVSTVGAGDAMVAAIAAGLLYDDPLEAIMRRATAFGAYSVGHIEQGIHDYTEIQALEAQVEVKNMGSNGA
ncbi:1-phosphofructokinase family hexose kinase [Spirochaeta africana]|uniref:1-phosphofructokinase n=1 Tax=Spirochaeta africana (strain ATCC 700263 / DSM 8902 / Z-7692) TaxID=889378 RepID=H9UGZ1_SPIAZ|nr:1-phosphofructokinase family hexose kinase [Spirochaeta africana]AFG36784.1 1-phosphofructokinase [Spirochaeta africana DSM 8902]